MSKILYINDNKNELRFCAETLSSLLKSSDAINFVLFIDGNINNLSDKDKACYTHLMLPNEEGGVKLIKLKPTIEDINLEALTDKPFVLLFNYIDANYTVGHLSDNTYKQVLHYLLDYFTKFDYAFVDVDLGSDSSTSFNKAGRYIATSFVLTKIKKQTYSITGREEIKKDFTEDFVEFIYQRDKDAKGNNLLFIRMYECYLEWLAINQKLQPKSIARKLAELFNSYAADNIAHTFRDDKEAIKIKLTLAYKVIKDLNALSFFLKSSNILTNETERFENIVNALNQETIKITTSDLDDWLIQFWQPVTNEGICTKGSAYDYTGRFKNILTNTCVDFKDDLVNPITSFESFRTIYYKIKLSYDHHEDDSNSWLNALKRILDEKLNQSVEIQQTHTAELFLSKCWLARLFDDIANTEGFMRYVKQTQAKVGITVKTKLPDKERYQKVALIINSSLACPELENINVGAFEKLITAERLTFFYSLYFIRRINANSSIYAVNLQDDKAVYQKINIIDELDTISIEKLFMNNADYQTACILVFETKVMPSR